MDYVTVDELGEKLVAICRRVEAGEEFVVTRSGEPFALLARTDAERLHEQLRALRLFHFGGAARRLQESAAASGASQLTDEEIQAEIDAVREERRHQTGRSAF